MMTPDIENPPAIVQTVDQPVKAKRKRRSRSKRIREGVVAGVKFNSPVTRMVAIFISGLTTQEKAYALQLLLQMGRMEAKPIQPATHRAMSPETAAANPRVDVIDSDTGLVALPSVSPDEAQGFAEAGNEINHRQRFVIAE